jgi:hypothetical protein
MSSIFVPKTFTTTRITLKKQKLVNKEKILYVEVKEDD